MAVWSQGLAIDDSGPKGVEGEGSVDTNAAASATATASSQFAIKFNARPSFALALKAPQKE